MRNQSKEIKKRLFTVIRQVCQDRQKHTVNPDKNFTRHRKLSFETLCKTILAMGGQSLNAELQQQFHFDPTAATTSAFVQQRSKILPSAFEAIFHDFTAADRFLQKWNGYRLLAVDGSHVQISTDTNDKKTYFNSTKDGRGYNLLHLNALYDLENRIYLDTLIQNGREENESQALVEMVDRSEINEPTILIADRGYEAYNNIAHIEQKGWYYVIRVKEKQGILSGLTLPDTAEFDARFQYTLSKRLTNRIRNNPHRYRWIPNKVKFDYITDHSDELYEISFRAVRFWISDEVSETVITNLPTEFFSPQVLKKLYRRRWGIETAFRGIKYTLALTSFHTKKLLHIHQEIYAKLTLYNFAAMLMRQVAFSQPNGCYLYQINSAAATHVARQFLLGNVHERNVAELITKYLLPIRPGQQKPRNMRVKRPSSFQYRMV